MSFSVRDSHCDDLLIAKAKKDFFQRNNVPLLDHPACSPDLNPIENLVKNTTWNNVLTSTLETLASSIAKQLVQVINKNGATPHY
uniref:Tc1-like transposase DDE domain-containing protein n=1 Tax=Gouania willdenowi TaxID=441366 RepID=A0A8C5HNZ2_GOUWI